MQFIDYGRLSGWPFVEVGKQRFSPRKKVVVAKTWLGLYKKTGNGRIIVTKTVAVYVLIW